MKKKKIMVVDDDKEFLEEITDLLASAGYETAAFSDGLLAIDNIDSIKPNLILLDLKMKGKNGFQVADELINIKKQTEIPIIAMTGYFTKEEHRFLMRVCGIKHCLLKPFNPLDIISKIEELSK